MHGYPQFSFGIFNNTCENLLLPHFHEPRKNTFELVGDVLKDGAYYCYCAYVLRISRYSDFLSPMLTNTEILLRGLKLSGESRS